MAVVIRDELGELYADEQFAAAFGVRGRPGWSPGRLMLVTVLQFAEHLTDRQAARGGTHPHRLEIRSGPGTGR